VAAFLSGICESELNRVVPLPFLIPVLLNLAESVSSQSVSVALQDRAPRWQVLLQEIPASSQ